MDPTLNQLRKNAYNHLRRHLTDYTIYTLALACNDPDISDDPHEIRTLVEYLDAAVEAITQAHAIKLATTSPHMNFTPPNPFDAE